MGMPWAFLAGGVIVVLLAVGLPSGGPQALGHALVNALGAVAVVLGVRRNRPHNPWPWLAIAASLVIYTITGVCWALWSIDPDLSLAGAIDHGLKPVAYLCFSVSLFLFLRDGRLARERSPVVDGLFSAFAGALVLLLWALIAGADADALGMIDRVAPFALTGLTAGLAVMGHRLARDRGQGSASMTALIAAGALVLAGLTLVTAFQPLAPRWVDATWLLASVLNGFAALHPSMAWPVATRSGARPALPEPRTLVLGAALLTNPLLIWLSVVTRERELLVVSLSVAGIAALGLLGMTSTEDDAGPARRPAARHTFRER